MHYATPSMLKITGHSIYRGPNPWAVAPVVVCHIEDSAAQDAGIASLANRAAERAKAALNEIRGYLHEVGAQAEGNGKAVFWVEFHHPRITFEAMTLAIASLNGEPGIEQQIEQLHAKCRRHHPDYQARILMTAARAHGIPVLPLALGSKIWQYGWGKHAELFFESASNGDGYLAGMIAASKATTKSVFAALGAPFPRYVLVSRKEDLPGAAQTVGWPCVVKPLDRGGGKGVTAGIRTQPDLVRAFAVARRFTTGPIMVEAYVPGDDHRLMVVRGELVAAIRRDPPGVVGDGRSSIAELMQVLNQGRSKNLVASNYLYPVALDETILAHLKRHGLTPESVPDEGQRVTLRSNANLCTGGSCTEMTADIHPEVRAMAEALGNTLGFAALGLDYITTDISLPLSGGAFIEANTTPGLSAAIAAGIGAEKTGTMLLGTSSRRIPAVLLLVADDTIPAVAATLKAEAATRPGLAWLCGNAAGIGILPLNLAHLPVWERTPSLLKHRSAGAVVVAWTPNDLVRHGAPFDRCDAVVIGNVAIPPGWEAMLAKLSIRPLQTITPDGMVKEALDGIAIAGE